MIIFGGDIETTGLNKSKDQIIEIGFVADNLLDRKPLAELPRFHAYVVHDRIEGDPFSIAMNAKIIEKIASPKKWTNCVFLRPEEVGTAVATWLMTQGIGLREKITVAGKNFGSFDRPFLEELPYFTDQVAFHHRSIDPASLFYVPGDKELPSLKLCMERAGISGDVTHTAVEDALNVIELVRVAYS